MDIKQPKTAADILANIDELLHPEHPELQDLELQEQFWLANAYAWIEVCLNLEDSYSSQLMGVFLGQLSEDDLQEIMEALHIKWFPDSSAQELLGELVKHYPEVVERINSVRLAIYNGLKLLEDRGVLDGDED